MLNHKTNRKRRPEGRDHDMNLRVITMIMITIMMKEEIAIKRITKNAMLKIPNQQKVHHTNDAKKVAK